MAVPVVWPFTTPESSWTRSASTRGVERPSPRARRLSMQAAMNASSTGTPAAMPSSTPPMARPWLSPKMVSANALPKVFFMAQSSMPSRVRRPSTGMVSARQQPARTRFCNALDSIMGSIPSATHSPW